jgi:hypothetical protein
MSPIQLLLKIADAQRDTSRSRGKTTVSGQHDASWALSCMHAGQRARVCG